MAGDQQDWTTRLRIAAACERCRTVRRGVLVSAAIVVALWFAERWFAGPP